jgi:protein-tyrosine phosphatase
VTRILFVCMGNICRSPTAEAIARDRIGEGIEFGSAGLRAFPGAPASPNGVIAAAEIGVDLAGHRAMSLTPEVAASADSIYVMTRSQRREVSARFPEVADRVALLDPDGGDVADPYGRDLEAYRRSRDHIVAAIEQRRDEWRRTAAG